MWDRCRVTNCPLRRRRPGGVPATTTSLPNACSAGSRQPSRGAASDRPPRVGRLGEPRSVPPVRRRVFWQVARPFNSGSPGVNVNAKAHHGCWPAFVEPTPPIPHVLTDITTLCQHHQAVTPAPKRNLPLKSYPMEPDLIAGLARLSRREHLPVSALVRRAMRRELEREGVVVPRALPPPLESEGRKEDQKCQSGPPTCANTYTALTTPLKRSIGVAVGNDGTARQKGGRNP